MTSVAEVAWFAGLFEGEGCINIEVNKLRPRLHVEMTDADVVRRAAAITGGSFYLCKKRKPGWKDVYRCAIFGDLAIQWLMTIYVLLGERRQERAREAIAYWRGRKRLQNGWNAHRAKHGCRCQQNTGSCQKPQRRGVA